MSYTDLVKRELKNGTGSLSPLRYNKEEKSIQRLKGSFSS